VSSGGSTLTTRWGIRSCFAGGAESRGAEDSSTSRRGRYASPIRRIHHKAGPIPCWIFRASTFTASKSARTIWV
jgi:hypothetical protein